MRVVVKRKLLLKNKNLFPNTEVFGLLSMPLLRGVTYGVAQTFGNAVLTSVKITQETSAVFSLVNFECPAVYCNPAERYVSSRMRGEFFKMT
jgi:hypothetical protein